MVQKYKQHQTISQVSTRLAYGLDAADSYRDAAISIDDTLRLAFEILFVLARSHDVAISIWQQSSEGRYSADIPDLSSIDSIVDEEDIESDNEDSASAPITITRPRVHHYQGEERPRTLTHEHSIISCATRGQDQLATNHRTTIISPQLSNIAAPIISAPGKEKASLAPSSPQKSPASTITDGASETSHVVFILLSTSDQQHPPIRTQVSASVQHEVNSTAPKKHAMFTVGGSSQSDNDSLQESSLESRMQQSKKNKARSNMFQLVVSSAEGAKSLRGSIQRNSLSDVRRRPEQKKRSFFKEVATRTIEQMSDDVFETDDSIDESAIDDDESSDWEDLMEKS
ncbi:hypothetical protein VE03_10384 [Pseudogymnoascus sp. 23342-1-I1]|nr:hypothetical protein VE03_10384 [Pseudogymnoascus sp. 23342-1-I1]